MKTAKDLVKLKGFTAAAQFKWGMRLKDMETWERNVRFPGSHDPWMNPNLFEQICDFDRLLETVSTNAADMDPEKLLEVENRLQILFTKGYLSVIIKKFRKLLPELAEYFAAKADYGGLFEADREDFKQMKSNLKPPVENHVIEDTNVRLFNC